MITNKSEKYLLISAIAFITYLLLGSFIVSKNFFELGYLVIFYMLILLKLFHLINKPNQSDKHQVIN